MAADLLRSRLRSDWTLSQGLFRRAGLLPNVALEVETIEAAKRMVERKLGFGFLPQIALSQELRQGKLISIEIVDAEPLSRNLDVIHPLNRPLAKEAQDFLRFLRAAAMTTAPETKPAAAQRSAGNK